MIDFKTILILFFVSLIPPRVFALDLSDGRWVDLTHEFSDRTIYWPTADSFKKTTVFEGFNEKGYFYSAYNIHAAEHGGTHLDAPIHFYQNGKTVEQIPIKQLVGTAPVIDISEKAKIDRDYQVSVQDITEWETIHGKLSDGAIVLFNTGFSRYWPDKLRYLGTLARGQQGVNELSFPGIHPNAARFLSDKRKIKAVGLDTASIDFGKSKEFKTHQILFKKNILGFENLSNLDQLPAKGTTVFALPMKIKGVSGAPLRIVAFVPNKVSRKDYGKK